MHNKFRMVLYATVFLTGAAVLVIEVAAVRLLSPYFGTSLFVLSSVLTTILSALSIGYYIGGRLSDRFPYTRVLYRIITVSGITSLLLLLVAKMLLPALSSLFTIMTGPLVFSLLLFFLPALLLGTVSPYIIKLESLHTSDEHIGSVVGATFFWGTVGSITGSLLSGFYLIPFWGVSTSLSGTGLLLVALGLGGRYLVHLYGVDTDGDSASSKKPYNLVALLVLFTTLTLLLGINRLTPGSTLDVVYESEGLYSHILIFEASYRGQPMRGLRRDTNSSSATFLESDELVYGYTKFSELYKTLLPDASRFLLIGGGAYSIPRTLARTNPELTIDIVEIEPVLHSLAMEYFDLPDSPQITNHISDGRVFLTDHGETYDVIFNDAFSTDLSVPPHLTSAEFFQSVAAHLTPEGVFMMNFVGKLYQEPMSLTGSLIKTVTSVFPNTKVYAFEPRYPDRLQNIMVVSRNGSQPIELPDTTIVDTNGAPREVADLLIDPGAFQLEEEIVLTDDRAPMEYLMVRQHR